MVKVTFEMEIESEEVPHALDMLRDIVQAFEFPVYEMSHFEDGNLITHVGGASRKVVTLPAGKPLSFQEFAEAVGLHTFDEEDLDETDPCIPALLPGNVVEVGGLVFQVFSIDATGRVVLDVMEELGDEDEDSFLCPPTVRH